MDDRVFFFIFPMAWLGINLIVSFALGFFSLYTAFPPVEDLIEDSFWWVQFARAYGHAPVSVKLGAKCLHIREPLISRPLFWQGPASIPYGSLRISKPSKKGFWAMFSTAQFEIPELDYRFRLSGRAGRALESRLAGMAGVTAPIAPPQPNQSIRPR